METHSGNNDGQERNALSQEPASSDIRNIQEQPFSQGNSPTTQPVHRDAPIQTEGGAYVAGSVSNQGGVNLYGGTVENLNYYASVQTSPTPTRPTRPENYI